MEGIGGVSIAAALLWACVVVALRKRCATSAFILNDNCSKASVNKFDQLIFSPPTTLRRRTILYLRAHLDPLICRSRRIALAISIIREAMRVVMQISLLCIFPVLQISCVTGVTALWLLYSVYLVAGGEVNEKTNEELDFRLPLSSLLSLPLIYITRPSICVRVLA